MQCPQAKNLIALLIGDDLGESERPQVEQHLSECGSCQTYHGELVESHKQLQSLAAVADTESPGLWNDMQPEVQLAAKVAPAKSTSKWTVALCTAALVMAMVGISRELVSPTYETGSNDAGIQTNWQPKPSERPKLDVDRNTERKNKQDTRLDQIR